MSKMYYNAEHYPDPTAGQALDNIMREERRNRRARVYHAPCKPREVPGQKAVKEALERSCRCRAIHFFGTPS
jgi:hypothetical protein